MKEIVLTIILMIVARLFLREFYNEHIPSTGVGFIVGVVSCVLLTSIDDDDKPTKKKL